jgi:hypothetical protein
MKPDTQATLASLKDFQRATAEYAFERLWLAEDQVKKFLVADEVGLGKTMVAKGVIAKTVDHLWETVERIDVVYICSNAQIARQNLGRLNVVGGSEVRHADRLTLLPKVIRNLRENRVNFVSFTPGTSFQAGSSGGAYPERVLLYWMLAEVWGASVTRPNRWKRFFEGGMRRHNFENQLAWFDRSSLDKELCRAFGEAIETSTGPMGGPLGKELEACALEFNYLRGQPSWPISERRYRLIGSLRRLVARAAVAHLEPDLVILDEFQRFKDLLDADHEGAQLARALFDHPDAKVLLLSATPYKMYTLPDEPEGDDHYEDFTRTVRFLAGDERAYLVERELRAMRESLLTGGDLTRARHARDRVQAQLRRVMSRTERLASTPDRDGMLAEKPLKGVRLAADDLRSWRTFDEVARQIDRHDVFEYWRSAPYPLNLMERNSYQVQTKFQAAAERNDPILAAALARARGLLDWELVRRFDQVDPGNAKLRGLYEDVLERGAWRLAWLPPSLPYYEPGGAYAEPALRSFTKRLVFSAWAVVPKAITVMLSYEAERRAVEAAGLTDWSYGRSIRPPLQFRFTNERPAGMPALALLYPCLTLARLGDPLEVARRAGTAMPLARRDLLETVKAKIRTALACLPRPEPLTSTADQRWYWAAPFLLDHVLARDEDPGFLRRAGARTDPEEDAESNLANHLHVAAEVADLELGQPPEDLEDVIAAMAIASPGVCALRALSRVAGGTAALARSEIRDAAYVIAQALRSLFNKPEIVTLLRSGDENSYWRSVLEHSLHGDLQAVLDEYVHVLLESEGLQDADNARRAKTLADAIAEALSTRTASNTVERIRLVEGEIQLDPQKISSHFAARYGRTETNDKAIMRESTVRVAFNSPFRPFVLASTSVGQEGLDFHCYSHAVVHWNLPGNPVDLEQREGRVHRYKGHAIRKNVAAVYGAAALDPAIDDPWEAVFDAAQADLVDSGSEIKPFWVFSRPGGAVIERYVPALPLSRESAQYERLQRTLGAYRLLLGQPRQDDLIRYVGDDVSWLRINLTPPVSSP